MGYIRVSKDGSETLVLTDEELERFGEQYLEMPDYLKEMDFDFFCRHKLLRSTGYKGVFRYE